MAVILLKFIFFFLSTISNLVTRLIFNALAHVVVQMIQTLKVPAEGSQQILMQVKDLIRTCLEYLLDLLIEAVSTIFSTLFDLIKEGVLNSSSGLAAVVAELVEKSKTSLDNVLEDVPEVLNAFTEMVGKIFADFWENCNEAIAYVTENVLN